MGGATDGFQAILNWRSGWPTLSVFARVGGESLLQPRLLGRDSDFPLDVWAGRNLNPTLRTPTNGRAPVNSTAPQRVRHPLFSVANTGKTGIFFRKLPVLFRRDSYFCPQLLLKFRQTWM